MRSLVFSGLLKGASAQGNGQGYGPDPAGVPAEFLCGWRRLALNYTEQVRPDIIEVAYDALDIKTYCGDSRPTASPALFPASEAPSAEKILYVDAINGTDDAAGTETQPVRTAHAALKIIRKTKPVSSAIVFRGGYHYFAETLDITPTDTNLTLQNYPGEEAWLTGSVELTDLHWKAYDMSPPEDVLMVNMSNAKGCQDCPAYHSDSFKSCQTDCDADTSCTSWVFDAGHSKCYLRQDHIWAPIESPNCISGYRTVAKNIWEVDLSSYDFSAISELRVDGERVTPARFPNANVEVDIWPIGYLSSTEQDWLDPKISPDPNPAQEVHVKGRDWDVQDSNYTGGIGGTCSIFDPPFSFFCQTNFQLGCGGCFTWNIPGGLQFGGKLGNKTYKKMENAVLFAWRKAHWANWAFEIEKYHARNSSFIFGKGGFQGARGGPGSDWYISHVLEELDAPTEFYYSPSEKKLYYFPAAGTKGAPPASTRFEAVQQHSLVRALGTQAEPVRGLRVLGLGFRDTASTMMEPHGVPSGGDWALERMGVVLLEGVVDASVEQVKMWKIGGNGVMLSKYAMRSRVAQSEFVWLGGTAVAAWGWTDEISDGGIHGIDGTAGDFPRYTLVEGNVFREIGIWEKQASGFFQAKAAETTLRHNVAFNLARAGFNFNDGFGGGDVIYENVLFNTCRESSDHGPINSWDRQPFITTILNGTPTSQMAFREVSRNVVIANYGGVKEVDNDDGSLFYRNHHNFMVYGWGQKFKCGGIESFNNVKAFIDLGGHVDHNAGCVTGPIVFYPNLWHNDTMVHLGETDFPYRHCWGSDDAGHNWDKTQVQNNTIYMASPDVHAIVSCGSQSTPISDFQADGNESGTKEFSGYPHTQAILRWGRAAIGETWAVEWQRRFVSLVV